MNARFLTPLLAVFACVFLFSSRSEAQGVGAAGNIFYQLDLTPVWEDSNPSIYQYGGSFPGDGSVNTYSTRGVDLKNTFGYAIDGTWLVGFSYNILSTSGKRDASEGGDNARDDKTARSEYGPTVGVLYNGWRAALTYLLFSETTYSEKQTATDGSVSSDTETINKKGKGFLLNLGYSVALTPWLQIGPSLIYRQVSYGARSFSDNVTPGNNYTDKAFLTDSFETTWTPYFSVTFRF